MPRLRHQHCRDRGHADAGGSLIDSSALLVGKAGNITITVGNFPNNAAGGHVDDGAGERGAGQQHGGLGGRDRDDGGAADGRGRAGAVEAGSRGSAANQPPGGGPITLKAGCPLTITPDGIVSSEGKDPGADLVHLEGCEVEVERAGAVAVRGQWRARAAEQSAEPLQPGPGDASGDEQVHGVRGDLGEQRHDQQHLAEQG